MAFQNAKTGCVGVMLLALTVAGCQDRRELTGDGGLLAGLWPPRERVVPAQEPIGVPKSAPSTAQPNQPSEPAQVIQRVAASELVSSSGDKAGASKDPDPATSDPVHMDLNQAIETGLSQNPDLVALRQAEGVNRAIVDVARVYPFNPTVQTRILPYARQGANTNPVYNYVLVWQQFELAHQRRFREQNAAAALNATRWNIQQAEVTNAALTSQLYFAALYQRGLRELAVLTAKLNDELLGVMEKRLKAGGKAAAADVAMVRIDTRTSRQQAALAEVNYKNGLLALRRQLNMSPETPLDLTGDLAAFTWHPLATAELGQLLGKESALSGTLDTKGLVGQLAGRRPDVLAAQSSADAGQANLRLARASRVPNLWFGPFYSRDSEAIVNLGFQAQMDIPVLNTGRPLVRQREAELRQQTITREQLEAKARVEIRTALDRYEQARLMCERARQESSQELPQELQKLEEEFRKGEIDILRIFQARNSLLLFRRTLLDSLNELAIAASVLSAAAGLPPAALISQARPDPEPEEQLGQPEVRTSAVLMTPLTRVP